MIQLSDLSFQRHILVQALILVDFLLSLTQKSKDRLAQLNTNKALRYAFTLNEENVGVHPFPRLCKRGGPPFKV